jgi:hypothetical protein
VRLLDYGVGAKSASNGRAIVAPPPAPNPAETRA